MTEHYVGEAPLIVEGIVVMTPHLFDRQLFRVRQIENGSDIVLAKINGLFLVAESFSLHLENTLRMKPVLVRPHDRAARRCPVRMAVKDAHHVSPATRFNVCADRRACELSLPRRSR